MSFVDTHTHLYDEAFGDIAGQDAAVKRAIESGVEMMVIPDESSASRKAVLDLCARWPYNTRAALGLHPTEVNADYMAELDLLEKALAEHPATAIGEIGMDLYWSREFEKEQQEAMRVQIELALQYDIPVIIHAREATAQCISIISEYTKRSLKGVFHAFSGSIETFREIERLGEWYVGIGGVVTFRKASIGVTVADIPLDRIVLETDSPYLTPVPHRGERNESSYIPDIAAFIAGRKGTSVEEVGHQTTENAGKLFKF